jgi:hypothetical protein
MKKKAKVHYTAVATYGAGAQDSMGNSIPESMMPVVRYAFTRWPVLMTFRTYAEVGVRLMAEGIDTVPHDAEGDTRLSTAIAPLLESRG